MCKKIKKGWLVFAFLPLISFAKTDTDNHVVICSLKAFASTFIDAGYTEREAKLNVRSQCELENGEASMFCTSTNISCFESSLSIR